MLSLLTMVGRLISTENPVVCIHFLFPLSIISLIFSVHQFGKGGTIVAKSTRPSVLEGLRRPMPQRAADKKSKTHEEVR